MRASDLEHLQLDQSWEESYTAYESKLATNTVPSDLPPEEARESHESEMSTDELTEMIDLVASGLPVAWPKGLDERVANLIVTQRATKQSPSGLPGGIAPARLVAPPGPAGPEVVGA